LLRDQPFESPCDFGFGLKTHDAVDLATRFQHEQRRDAVDAEACRDGGILVDIQFSNAYAAR
jgi:hypothetical protein